MNVKKYRKLQKKHTKKLVKVAKKTKDFDYGYFHDLVMTQIQNMYEMYEDRDIVWQSDESRQQIADQLKEIIDLDNEIEAFTPPWEEEELLRQIYIKIGENIQYWWD